MRILIIATERSGSTTLMKGISSVLNIPYIREPFLPNELDSSNKDYSSENVIVKTLIGQQPSDSNHFYFLKNLINEFDKVILLGRKNVNNRYESFINAKQLENWHVKYTNQPSNFSDFEKYFFKNYIILTNELLKLFSKEINQDIIWYESLYSNKETSFEIIKKLDIPNIIERFDDLYNLYLSPNHRYLQEQKTI